MELHTDIGWLMTALLCSVRVAAALAFAPLFGPAQIPAPVRVLLALSLGVLLVVVAPPATFQFDSSLGFALAAAREALIGAAFAFGLLCAYAATQVAGRALDIQIGFGAASVLNPAAQGLAPLLGSLFGMSFIVVFLSLDGHHVFLRAMALSMATLPPGGTDMVDAALIVRHSGVMFVFGLALAAPVMFALWLADITMAVFARSMPQLNVFLLSFAVKIALGLVGLALSIGLSRTLFDEALRSTFRYWDNIATG